MVDYSEIFKSGLKSVARTHSIHESLEQNTKLNLDEIKSKSRETETKIVVAADRLIKDEFFLDDKTTMLVTKLQTEIKERFPKFNNLALVVAGSSLHGGRLIREALETTQYQDLDLVLFCDSDTKPTLSDTLPIKTYLDNRIKDIGKEFGFSKNFKLCHTINPGVYTYPNFHSANEVLSLIEHGTSYKIDYKILDNITLAFFPSFPPDVNRNNQSQVLEALRFLYDKNPVNWKFVVNELTYHWKTYHKISLKHLLEKQAISKYQIDPQETHEDKPQHARNRLPSKILTKYDDIITASEETMVKHFQNLLETTKA